MRSLAAICRCLLASQAIIFGTVASAADLTETIERIKPSIVVVGTFKNTSSPQFVMRGTGFVVGFGNLVATNAHVFTEANGPDAPVMVIRARTANGEPQIRRAFLASIDKEHDLAVLRIEGSALPAVKLGNSDQVREGQSIAFTGFPLGGALGFSPVTHRGIVSSVTPIALPGGNAQQINEKLIRKIRSGTFNILQLDATAYPGNSGSPVFDTDTGEILGIVNMVFIKSTREAALSQPSGISYAIPVNYLLEILKTVTYP